MLISVITINYNDCSGLEHTIKSVHQQNFRDFEHIIIDGGSNDGSKDLILDNKDRFSYWVSEKDRGIYNAMNKGIIAAKGEYLLFLNSGDYLSENNVLKTVAKSLFDCEILYGDIIYFNSNVKYIKKGFDPNKLTVYSFFKGTISHPASFIKKDLFDQYGLYDESLQIVADWKFFLKVVGILRVKVKYIECVISYFNLNGVSSNNFDLIQLERNQVLSEMIPKGFLEDYKKYEYMSKVQNLKLVRWAIKIESSFFFKRIKNFLKIIY